MFFLYTLLDKYILSFRVRGSSTPGVLCSLATDAGFNAPSQWENLSLLIVPLVLLIGPTLFFQPQLPSPARIVVLIIVTLLTGFQEEAIFRGVLLRAFRPQGVMKAVLTSAALFGIIHINLLLVGRDPIFVLSQVIASFFGAIGLGALRIRMNTVVPRKSEEHKPRSHGV